MHVEKPVTTDVCFKTEAAVLVFLVFPSSSSGQKTQEKEKNPADTREAKWRRDWKREVRLNEGN